MYFIDTNLFIYQLDTQAPDKSSIANRIIRTGIATGNACISFQVVQECLNTILRKAEITLSREQAETYLDVTLTPLLRVYPSITLYKRALEIQARYQFGFYDSLIIAAALEAGCKTLYSEDLQAGQRIEQLTVQNPFME
ncbi:MAG: PIN domain-containing protein [Gammaproteobacteria bacterium]|jgi:predicted nucleic acid-binding protein|nr:PIN domain-containing protein [Gammaproteobacteria bacterium]